MKPITLIGLLALTATVGGASFSARVISDADDEAIRATIQHYFDGGYEMRKGFYPDANMWYVRDGTLHQVPIEDFLSRVEANADRPPGEVTKSIVTIDRFGNAAVAKLELKRPSSLIYDYMSLLKINGEWLIVNKIFDMETTDKE
jgi:protease I